jgi:hypothetical protein
MSARHGFEDRKDEQRDVTANPKRLPRSILRLSLLWGPRPSRRGGDRGLQMREGRVAPGSWD